MEETVLITYFVATGMLILAFALFFWNQGKYEELAVRVFLTSVILSLVFALGYVALLFYRGQLQHAFTILGCFAVLAVNGWWQRRKCRTEEARQTSVTEMSGGSRCE